MPSFPSSDGRGGIYDWGDHQSGAHREHTRVQIAGGGCGTGCDRQGEKGEVFKATFAKDLREDPATGGYDIEFESDGWRGTKHLVMRVHTRKMD